MEDNSSSEFVKSSRWLFDNLSDENMRIVDASWYLPNQNRNAVEEYQEKHIPSAVFFDQDKIVNPNSNLPHALPNPETFASAVGAMGISDEHTIVVYDGLGLFSSPRIWWMFKIMGAKSVFVLDGGLSDWVRNGLPTEHSIPSYPPSTFEPKFNGNAVADSDDIFNAINIGLPQILDARGEGRFYGKDPEPREGMRSGHMPSAINIPYSSLLNDGKLLNINDLKSIFKKKDVDLNQPSITSCGSGVTAAVITLALYSVGHTDTRLYDGSWSEWGSRQDTPITTDS